MEEEEEVVTVVAGGAGLVDLSHPTLLPHQVAELSQAEQWKQLNAAALKCFTDIRNDPVVLTVPYCNRTWDNVMCWPDTPAGTVGYQRCPSYINGFDHAEYATRTCLENGTWETSSSSGSGWTNFTACMAKGPSQGNTLPALIVEHMPSVKLMYTIGYTLSLAALILAVSIMIYFRRLHCARNMIHLNMFIAFLARAVMSMIRTLLMVKDVGFPHDVNVTGDTVVFIPEGTHWQCKLFFVLFNYIIFASLMWLFNEGLYLVLILSVSVFAERTKVRWFVFFAWGTPLLFIIPWVVLRIKFDDNLCWNVHIREDLYWVVRGPVVASVVINFIFFLVILRVLFLKLNARNAPDSRRTRYRKLAKSTLILIPLFAVYYMGFLWLPDKISPTADLFKLYVEMLFNSFQGFLVALLFCFLNAEVQNELRKKWHLLRKDSWRSQPSNGSFLRGGGRSGVTTTRAAGFTTQGDQSAARRQSSQSCSFLDSSAASPTKDTVPNTNTTTTTTNPATNTTTTQAQLHHHLHHHYHHLNNQPNGNLPAISEKSTLLGDSAGGGSYDGGDGKEASIPLKILCQDPRNNNPPDTLAGPNSCLTPPPVEDVADTGFSEDSCDEIPGSDAGDPEDPRDPDPRARDRRLSGDDEATLLLADTEEGVGGGRKSTDSGRSDALTTTSDRENNVIIKGGNNNCDVNTDGGGEINGQQTGFDDVIKKCVVEAYRNRNINKNSCGNASNGKDMDDEEYGRGLETSSHSQGKYEIDTKL